MLYASDHDEMKHYQFKQLGFREDDPENYAVTHACAFVKRSITSLVKHWVDKYEGVYQRQWAAM